MTRLLLVVAVASGCRNVCGTYTYKGFVGTEECGDVYGTQGYVHEGVDDPSVGWVLLEPAHDVPPGRFDFDHEGSVVVHALWEPLEAGEVLGPESVWTECVWTDEGRPLDGSDDVAHREPATFVEIQSHGGRFNLDVGTSYVRKLSWHIVCGDGVIELEAKDVVELERRETYTLSDQLTEWLAVE
ncbi:MAG: hypothetical protein KC656_10310 [Myxococcales bacterium]|nr:hypothetical protein [Myxococcales bacterium]